MGCGTESGYHRPMGNVWFSHVSSHTWQTEDVHDDCSGELDNNSGRIVQLLGMLRRGKGSSRFCNHLWNEGECHYVTHNLKLVMVTILLTFVTTSCSRWTLNGGESFAEVCKYLLKAWDIIAAILILQIDRSEFLLWRWKSSYHEYTELRHGTFTEMFIDLSITASSQLIL